MPSGFEEPERSKRSGDGADGVHEAFEAEGAAVGARRNVSGEQSFLRGRTHAAAQPCGGAAEEYVIGVRRESERRRRKGGEGVTKDGEWLAALQAIGKVAGGKFGETG